MATKSGNYENNDNEYGKKEDLRKDTTRIRITDRRTGKSVTFYADDVRNADSELADEEFSKARSKSGFSSLYSGCYWILYWLITPVIISSILQSAIWEEIFPRFCIIGEILSIICLLSYGSILLILRRVNQNTCYSRAGVLYILVAVFYIFALVFTRRSGSDLTMLSALLILVAFIVYIIALYNEITAHSIAMNPINKNLSRKWKNYWRWFLGLFFGGPVVGVLLAAVFGVILSINYSFIISMALILVAFIVLYILKILYLYQTAREYSIFEASYEDTLNESEE